MKKLMFGMVSALALCGMAIESSNTVGYQTKAVDAGKFAIAAIQFEGTDGSTDINKLVSGVTGVSQLEDENFAKTAPHIQVPNAKGTYDLYYYLTDGWFDNGTPDGDFKPGWCDASGMIAGEEGGDASGVLIPGVAIWIRDAIAETFQQAGQVPTEDVTVTAPATFALRANSFPVAFNLNDSSKVTFEGLVGVSQLEDENFAKTAPHIQVPNAKGTYDLYYYLTDGWYDNGTPDGGFKPGWCDASGMIAGEEGGDASGDVPVGVGFWTKGVSKEFSITFKK